MNKKVVTIMLNLNDREWKTFPLKCVFSISSTASSIDKTKLIRTAGSYPYITRTETNNGINDFVCVQPNFSTDSGNCITVGLDTQTVFYQQGEFYTGQNIQILRNDYLNAVNAKFFIPLLKNVLSIFSWGGNGATLTRLRRSKILLPVDCTGEIDYIFMEQYIKEREQKILQNYITHIKKNIQSTNISLLSQKEWKEFYINDIFVIHPGKRLTKSNMQAGKKPFIGASESNNGVTKFVSNTNTSEDSNVLGVNYNGSVVENFYHPYTCIFSDDVKRFVLKEHKGNEYIYLFLKTVILQQKTKYAYGYKFNEERMQKQMILLPVTESGAPDYNYMEQYAKQKFNYLILKYLREKVTIDDVKLI
ncbi:MAG: restriction endonuclease subunit S [Huintestinicola sp.]